jgi:hypothetical protein
MSDHKTLHERIKEATRDVMDQTVDGHARPENDFSISDDQIGVIILLLRKFTRTGDLVLLEQAQEISEVPIIVLLEFYHKALTQEADRFVSMVAKLCWGSLTDEERLRFTKEDLSFLRSDDNE